MWSCCYHSFACPQVVGGKDGLQVRSHRQLTGAGSSGEVWARCNNSWLQELLVTKYDKDRLGGITQVDHILIDIREHSNILLQSVTEVDMINGHYSVVVKKLG